jgi:hypothetical protein
MAEDIENEDIVGHIFWFELVATDSGAGAAQVARFPAEVAVAECEFDFIV